MDVSDKSGAKSAWRGPITQRIKCQIQRTAGSQYRFDRTSRRQGASLREMLVIWPRETDLALQVLRNRIRGTTY